MLEGEKVDENLRKGASQLKNTRLHQMLAIAMAAALEAGVYFRSRLYEAKRVTVKTSLADVVTDVDPVCEQMIRARIAAAFPDHDVLGEEETAPGSDAAAEAAAKMATAPSLWVVDPLDGTTNFVAGLPLSVVSIGYAEHGEVVVGVVYDPYRDELFLAARGSGAYVCDSVEATEWITAQGKTLVRGSSQPSQAQTSAAAAGHNKSSGTGGDQSLPGRRMEVSAHTELQESIVATGFPSRAVARAQATEAGLRVAGKVKNLRALGAAALHLAYTAAGRIDAFWEYDLNAWDLAGGVCLIEEAGGVAASIDGHPYDLTVRDIIVGGQPALTQVIQSIIGTV